MPHPAATFAYACTDTTRTLQQGPFWAITQSAMPAIMPAPHALGRQAIALYVPTQPTDISPRRISAPAIADTLTLAGKPPAYPALPIA